MGYKIARVFVSYSTSQGDANRCCRVNGPEANEFDSLSPIVDLTAKEFLLLQFTDLIENMKDKFVHKRTENSTGDSKQEQ